MAAPLGARTGGHKRTRLRSTRRWLRTALVGGGGQRVVAAVWPPCHAEGFAVSRLGGEPGRRRSHARPAESHVAAAAASHARSRRRQRRCRGNGLRQGECGVACGAEASARKPVQPAEAVELDVEGRLRLPGPRRTEEVH
uniref:Uncharacterized protein n=1 Tax=Oryza nivara TaxID=4536 RepID=A0A0E0I087_ORYNI